MTRIKVCGIQKPSHALKAASAGADFIGLVFVPGRKRCVDEGLALRIVSTIREKVPSPPKLVGIFANQPLVDVDRTIGRCGLDMVQLSGGESLEYIGQLAVPVIRVLYVSDSIDPLDAESSISREMEDSATRGHTLTLDRQVDGLEGGSGLRFDWSIAQSLSARRFQFFLAGGLTPENVSQAIRQVRPWGVDVSSGVETNGVKDGEKICAFVKAVRAATPTRAAEI